MLLVETREEGRPRGSIALPGLLEDLLRVDTGAGARSSVHHSGRTECSESDEVLRVRWWYGMVGWCVSAERLWRPNTGGG
jgi:hypothetical protein